MPLMARGDAALMLTTPRRVWKRLRRNNASRVGPFDTIVGRQRCDIFSKPTALPQKPARSRKWCRSRSQIVLIASQRDRAKLVTSNLLLCYARKRNIITFFFLISEQPLTCFSAGADKCHSDARCNRNELMCVALWSTDIAVSVVLDGSPNISTTHFGFVFFFSF